MNGVLGEIRLFGGLRVPNNWLECQGQVLPIAEFNELFSVIGGRFGGDGTTSLGLPQIPPAQTVTYSFEGLKYVICTIGSWPSSGGMEGMLGEIRLWAGTQAPQGWARCDGSVVNANTNPALYSVLGNTYGGSPGQTFGLPNLPDLNGSAYILCVEGAYPLPASDSEDAPVEVYLGEVRLWAGAYAPSGFAVITSPVFLNLNLYEALYAILGNDYGGFFPQNFQLPQLNPLPANPGSDVSYICVTQGIFPDLF